MAEQFEVVFLGTGSPLPNPERCGSGTVLVAGGSHILVDCGWGAARRLLPSGVFPGMINTLVFTHMHSDHISDFPDFFFQRWVNGAQAPLKVFGPEGTRETIEGFLMAIRQDIGFRKAHHGDKLHPDGARVDVVELRTSSSPCEFLELEELRLESFEVDHFPVVPALGYRATYDGRSVVLSGDTSFCETLLAAAAGVDMLISEAVNVEILGQRIENLRKLAMPLQASLFEDIPDYHLPTMELARLARDADVGSLVITHLIPPISNGADEVDAFIAGMADVYDGPIHVSHDTEHVVVKRRR